MDATQILEHDHRMVEQLLRDYWSAGSDQQRRAVVEIIIRELSKHAALEELMIYPLAKKVVAGGKREIDDHLREHAGVKKLLAELDALPTGDLRTDGLIEQLETELEQHIAEEEGDLLPKLREARDEQSLDALGQALDAAKQTAPTRPHPHAPNQPPGLAMISPVAAAYDRLRDRMQGRPRT
jgi:hemerythrin superfamily protein